MEPTKIYRAKLRFFRPSDGSFPSPSLPTPRGSRGVPKMAPSCGFRVRGPLRGVRANPRPPARHPSRYHTSHINFFFKKIYSRTPLPYQSVFRVSVCIAQTGRSLIHFFIFIVFILCPSFIYGSYLAGRTSTKPLVSLWPRMRHTDDRE